MPKYFFLGFFFLFKTYFSSETIDSMIHPYLDTSPHPILRKIPLSMIWQSKEFFYGSNGSKRSNRSEGSDGLERSEGQVFGMMSFEVKTIRFTPHGFFYLSLKSSGSTKCKKKFAFVSQNSKWNSFAFGSEVHWNENIELDLLG